MEVVFGNGKFVLNKHVSNGNNFVFAIKEMGGPVLAYAFLTSDELSEITNMFLETLEVDHRVVKELDPKYKVVHK